MLILHGPDLLLQLLHLGCGGAVSATGGRRLRLLHDGHHRVRADLLDVVDRVDGDGCAAGERRAFASDEQLVERDFFRLLISGVEWIGARFGEGNRIGKGGGHIAERRFRLRLGFGGLGLRRRRLRSLRRLLGLLAVDRLALQEVGEEIGLAGLVDMHDALGDPLDGRGLRRHRDACGIARDKIDTAKNKALAGITGALAGSPIKGRITVSGYEGSELLVARLLIESGAEVPYVGTACPRTVWSDPDREWREARGVQVQFRASLEQDIAAVDEFGSDLAIGTTPVVQHAKERSIPALYFTNLISARPLMGAAGAGSLAQVINAALANKGRFDRMTEFFDGVGTGHASGVWETTPEDRPDFKARYAKTRAAARAQEEAVGT